MIHTILQKTLDVFQKNFLRIIGYSILFNSLTVILMFPATVAFAPCVAIAHTHAKIAMARGEPVSIRTSLKKGFSLGIKPFAHNIVWAFRMIINFILLIFPALYRYSSWYYSSHLLIDEKNSVEDTLYKSSKLAKHTGMLIPYKLILTMLFISLIFIISYVVCFGLITDLFPSLDLLKTCLAIGGLLIAITLILFFSMAQTCAYVIAKASFEESKES